MVCSDRRYPGHDTVSMYNFPKSIPLDVLYDAIVSFPVLNRQYKIRDISIHNDKIGTHHCTDGYSYYLNDTFHTVVAIPDGGRDGGAELKR